MIGVPYGDTGSNYRSRAEGVEKSGEENLNSE
jgi:hypothetical protein